MRAIVRFLIILALLGVVAMAVAIEWGGPKPLEAVATPARATVPGVESEDRPLPPLDRYESRSGALLAYRRYVPDSGPARASITLLHGVTSSSASLDTLAHALASAGFEVDVLDLRGHGASGLHGVADQPGQLVDDVADFLAAAKPVAPRLLMGFGEGGALALRIVGGTGSAVFDGAVLAAPFLGERASTWRGGDDASLASIGRARIVAIDLLERVGIDRFRALPVAAFAVPGDAAHTPLYSWTLWHELRADPRSRIGGIARPLEVVVGADDEQAVPDRYAAEFERAGHPVTVTIVPRAGHDTLVTEPPGIQAIVDSANRLAGR